MLKTVALLFISGCCVAFMSCAESYNDVPAPLIEVVEQAPDTVLTPEEEIMAFGIDTFFKKRMASGDFNGNVLFAVDGKVIHKAVYGYSNLKKKDTLNHQSRFQLASLSKPFTAYAILLLAQEGKLKLEDNVKKYIPGFPYDGITIKMCLTHRSGMSNYTYFADEHWPDRYINPIHNKDVMALYQQHVPQYYYPPDLRFDYSNTGYMMLASIVEKASGKDFQSYMKANVFDPIGMKNTLVYRKEKDVKREIQNEAIGYIGKSKKPADDTYLNGVVGDKGVYSTTEDLLLFDKALREAAPLQQNWLDSAFTPRNEHRKKKDNYGYGWRIRATSDNKKLVYHTGWWKGFRSYFLRDLETNSVIIVLTNVKRGPFLKTTELLGLMGIVREKPASL